MDVFGLDIPMGYFAEHASDAGIRAAQSSFQAWNTITEAAEWNTPQHIQAAHPKASILKAGRVVFNIKGNDYRLVCRVQYQAGVLAIRFFGSHAEYDKIDAETV